MNGGPGPAADPGVDQWWLQQQSSVPAGAGSTPLADSGGYSPDAAASAQPTQQTTQPAAQQTEQWWLPQAGAPIHDDTIGTTPHQGPDQQTSGGLGAKILLGAAAIAMVAGGIGGATGYLLADNGGSATAVTSPVVSGGQTSVPADGTVASVAAAVLPSVVNISAGDGQGSGFVLRSDGYIVTNNHVVGNADTVKVTFEDGSTETADVVGTSPGYDLAVIKVDASGLPASTLGVSDQVNVGDTAIAIGSPLGLQGTVTTGIISSLDRPVTAGDGGADASYINALQTDAAINPGNSGGPLVDGEGRVIGVNSAIANLGSSLGGQAGSIGLGFAIPIDTVKRISTEIIDTGDSQTPIIGANIDNRYDGEGAQVGEVTAGGPADKAGLENGDIITAVDGRTVADFTELVVAIRDKGVGDDVTLTVDRGGDESEITVTLGASSE